MTKLMHLRLRRNGILHCYFHHHKRCLQYVPWGILAYKHIPVDSIKKGKIGEMNQVQKYLAVLLEIGIGIVTAILKNRKLRVQNLSKMLILHFFICLLRHQIDTLHYCFRRRNICLQCWTSNSPQDLCLSCLELKSCLYLLHKTDLCIHIPMHVVIEMSIEF